jgi:hypothetical protein
MQSAKRNADSCHRSSLPKVAAITMALAMCLPAVSQAQRAGQKSFSSAEQATSALVKATESNNEKAMLEILGRDGKQIVSSGDDAEDAENRANFVKRYREMHRLVTEPDGTTILYIGAHNWPTPIPIAHKGDSWYFDTEVGKKEILYRRIGRNEISAIHVCAELASAEKDYSGQHGNYAQKIYSDDGQHNGLFWKAGTGEPQSPIGPLVASAFVDSGSKDGAPTPYRGYYFHVLANQKDGDGKTGGLAFIAYPAEYRSSGVMSFIVDQGGVVYQKDLGKKTKAVAKNMKDYDPHTGWQKAEEQQEQASNIPTK